MQDFTSRWGQLREQVRKIHVLALRLGRKEPTAAGKTQKGERALQSAGDRHFWQWLCGCGLWKGKKKRGRRWDESAATRERLEGAGEGAERASKVGESAIEAGGKRRQGGGVGGMREIKNEGRGVREWLRESKQARLKNQSGERDNPRLFIYSSYFQGTSQEAFSL